MKMTDTKFEKIYTALKNQEENGGTKPKYAYGFRLQGGDLKTTKDDKTIVPKEHTNAVLQAEYSVPSGRDKFYEKIQDKYQNISKREVGAFVNSQETNQLHKPESAPEVVKPIIVKTPRIHYQIDLFEMKNKGANDQKPYVFNMIDIFSKYMFLKPIPNKEAETVQEAIKEGFETMGKPRRLQSDNGAEFKNETVDDYLKSVGVKQVFSSPYSPTTQGAVERSNRTIKTWLYKKMTEQNTKRWIDFLDDAVELYNNSTHSSTKYTPFTLHYSSGKNQRKAVRRARDRMVGKAKKYLEERKHRPELEVGDQVRIAIKKIRNETAQDDNEAERATEARRQGDFRSKLGINWSKEIYTVASISYPRKEYLRETYQVEDKEGKRLPTIFKRGELQKIGEPKEEKEEQPQEEQQANANEVEQEQPQQQAIEAPPDGAEADAEPEPEPELRRSKRERKANVRFVNDDFVAR